MKLNEKLESRRKELGLTLQDIGNKVGVSKQTVSKWENGEIKDIGISKISILAKVLKVDPISLVVDDKELQEQEYNETIPVLSHFDRQLLDMTLQLDPLDKIDLFNYLKNKLNEENQ